MSSIYCIIPARLGSKRIPNKNFRQFCNGKSMYIRARNTAVAAGVYRPYITVSSDDRRPANLCTDEVGLLPVMHWHCHDYDIDDIVVCLLPCTPLLRPETLTAAINSYRDNYAATHEMMASVCEYAHPVQRALGVHSKSKCLYRACNQWNVDDRTQTYYSLYHDAGQFYIATAKRWCEDTPILDGARPWLLPRYEAVDIDTEEDWQLAEMIYRGRKQ